MGEGRGPGAEARPRWLCYTPRALGAWLNLRGSVLACQTWPLSRWREPTHAVLARPGPRKRWSAGWLFSSGPRLIPNCPKTLTHLAPGLFELHPLLGLHSVSKGVYRTFYGKSSPGS